MTAPPPRPPYRLKPPINSLPINLLLYFYLPYLLLLIVLFTLFIIINSIIYFILFFNTCDLLRSDND